MLRRSLILEIRRLLNEGELSQREIAEQLRVSRGTVHAVASGQRDLRGHSDEDARSVDRPPAQRCGGCGALVYMPCVLCRARQHQLTLRGLFFSEPPSWVA